MDFHRYDKLKTKLMINLKKDEWFVNIYDDFLNFF